MCHKLYPSYDYQFTIEIHSLSAVENAQLFAIFSERPLQLREKVFSQTNVIDRERKEDNIYT